MSGFSPRFSITNAITRNLTMIERARGFLDAATLSDEWVRRMSQRALLLEAHHTTHIEGTQLTIEQSARLWRGEGVEEADADDVRELLNYRRAFEFLSEFVSGGGPVSESLIREIHKRLVEGVRGGSARPGEYRRVQNYVAKSDTGEIVYKPPPPGDVPALMAELVDWLRVDNDIHPVLVSGIAQFQFVHIHPFVDGNGRTSRLLSTLCLYRFGYDFKRLFTLSEYYDRDRPAFYRALQSVREQEMDLTGWLEFFCQGLATQLEEVKKLGLAAMKSDIIGKTHRLNSRQMAAIEHMLIVEILTIEAFEHLAPSVNRRTLQRDLRGMLAKGLITEFGTGATDPNRCYRLAEL